MVGGGRIVIRCAPMLRILSLSVVAFATAAADESAAPVSAVSQLWPVFGSLAALVLGFIQLIVGLSLAAFAITKGLAVLSKLLGGIDIWAEIQKKNLAVALLAAGVVISYCTVIGSGIGAMTSALFALGADPLGGLTGLFSGILNLVIAIMVASFAVTVVFKVMDKLTTGIDEKAEFANGNVAIGIIYCGTLIGVSGLVASGVKGIGTGVAMLITALWHLIAV
jgi:uncharacterized membrane protein YjfL (UPF0719 family)